MESRLGSHAERLTSNSGKKQAKVLKYAHPEINSSKEILR